MYKIFLISTLFLITFSACKDLEKPIEPINNPTENAITFNKTIEGTLNESLNDVIQLSDESYICIGTAYDNATNTSKALVIKFDKNGNKTNEYKVGDFNNGTSGIGLAKTNNGAFFLGVNIWNKTTNKNEVQVLKISSSDVVQTDLTKTFTADYISIVSINSTSDGGCILTGVKRRLSTDKNQIWVVRLDASANQMFDVTFDGWTGKDIVQTGDGGFILVGETENVSNKILKINSIGEKIWEDGPYSHAKFIIPFGIALAKDGSYLMGGDAQDYVNNNSFYYAYAANIKTDKSIAWNKSYGGADYNFGRSICTAANGDVVVVGLSGNNINNNGLFIKTDASGNNPIRKEFGGAKNEGFTQVIATKDGGYLMVGYTYSTLDSQSDVFLVKTDKSGEVK